MMNTNNKIGLNFNDSIEQCWLPAKVLKEVREKCQTDPSPQDTVGLAVAIGQRIPILRGLQEAKKQVKLGIHPKWEFKADYDQLYKELAQIVNAYLDKIQTSIDKFSKHLKDNIIANPSEELIKIKTILGILLAVIAKLPVNSVPAQMFKKIVSFINESSIEVLKTNNHEKALKSGEALGILFYANKSAGAIISNDAKGNGAASYGIELIFDLLKLFTILKFMPLGTLKQAAKDLFVNGKRKETETVFEEDFVEKNAFGEEVFDIAAIVESDPFPKKETITSKEFVVGFNSGQGCANAANSLITTVLAGAKNKKSGK